MLALLSLNKRLLMCLYFQVLGVQSLGGTGALRLGADLLYHHGGKRIVYVTDPTWGMYATAAVFCSSCILQQLRVIIFVNLADSQC